MRLALIFVIVLFVFDGFIRLLMSDDPQVQLALHLAGAWLAKAAVAAFVTLAIWTGWLVCRNERELRRADEKDAE